MRETLLSVRDLAKHFQAIGGGMGRSKQTAVRAVDGVSFDIYRGETLGLVGESGCGKSTTGRLILRLVEATSGSIWFEGTNLLECNAKQLRQMRREMQLVFQDPFASLNPKMTVGKIVREPLDIYGIGSTADRTEAVSRLLNVVGLSQLHADRYPGEFSGGQRQRICIARALALQPKFVVCDEPVSALDVSIQAQIINLLKDLQDEYGLTYLFISHDLNVVENICDRVIVMYLGRVVEVALTKTIFEAARHPYTQALLSAIPVADPTAVKQRTIIEGDVADASGSTGGCSFSPRCPLAREVCREREPSPCDLGDGHIVACHVVASAAGDDQSASA